LRSFTDLMSLFLRTITDWFAAKYGEPKSTTLARFGVIVIDDAAMSKRCWAIARKIVSKLWRTNVTFLMPSSLAAASTKSTSNPTTVLDPGLAKNSKGA
jgi:hypothetical protein